MIVVKIYGGLGNQLFQYSFGLYLSKKNNVELILDTSWFEQNYKKSTPRTFDLKYFNLSASLKNSLSLKFKLFFYNNIFFKRISLFKKLKVYRDNDFDLLMNANITSAYLDGYWHNCSYLQNIKGLLKDEFKPKFDFFKLTDFSKKIINTKNSVAIHIRRGDYITNGNYAICSTKYFLNAIEKISNDLINPEFFIFSDDIEFAKKEITTNLPVYFAVNYNTYISNIEDFFNMSLCKHHIISNSTFSWWASWLNVYPKNIVIIPECWYTNDKLDASEYYLENYITLKND